MPRKTKEYQTNAGQYGSRNNQWPRPSIWGRRKRNRDGDGLHPFVETAVNNWFSKRMCAPECPDCANRRRVSRLRAMYGRRR